MRTIATSELMTGTRSRRELIEVATRLANSVRFDSDDGASDMFPSSELDLIRSEGLLNATLPRHRGGGGLGDDPGSQRDLLKLLSEVGRANLSLGRIYEGHVNALQLIEAFGTEEQRERVARDCARGKLFAVWNTDSSDPLRLSPDGLLTGAKAFASAAAEADRALVMAETIEGRLMCLIEMGNAVTRMDSSSWQPMGMEASGSFTVDLTGTTLTPDSIVGKAGDYYSAPLFQGGAIRTTAVIFGGLEALFRYLRSYLAQLHQTGRPMQQCRAARIHSALQSARGWMDFAATEAEIGLHAGADARASARMDFAATAVRIAVESLGPQIIQLVSESVGARGLLRPSRFGRLIRDLTMFLRQPNPDDCLLRTGQFILETDVDYV